MCLLFTCNSVASDFETGKLISLVLSFRNASPNFKTVKFELKNSNSGLMWQKTLEKQISETRTFYLQSVFIMSYYVL